MKRALRVKKDTRMFGAFSNGIRLISARLCTSVCAQHLKRPHLASEQSGLEEKCQMPEDRIYTKKSRLFVYVCAQMNVNISHMFIANAKATELISVSSFSAGNESIEVI